MAQRSERVLSRNYSAALRGRYADAMTTNVAPSRPAAVAPLRRLPLAASLAIVTFTRSARCCGVVALNTSMMTA